MQRCTALANAHICLIYAALVASPRALPDGLILVFQHPVKKRVHLRIISHFVTI